MRLETTLRDATEADLPAIQRIYAHAVRHGTATFEETPPEVAELTGRLRTVRSHGFPWLVATPADQVVGYAYADWFRPRSAYRFTCEDSIYLAQRRGAGTQLLGALLARGTAAGSQQMLAVIGDSANAASTGLLRRFGFELVGTMRAVGRKFDRWLDVVILQRTLAPAAAAAPTVAPLSQ